ncbi:MAG: hypothetical protein JSS99_04805 [Actinobacteria bacterium]|nr:hypothetical protein [Actinomycetota bacterium]
MENAGSSKLLTVQIGLGPDAEAEDFDAAALALRRELLELDAVDARRAPGPPARDGARALDGPLLGALLVTASDGAIPAILQLLGAWARRGPERSVKLKLGDDAIEVTGVTDATQRELIDAFLARNRSHPSDRR